MEKHVGTKDSDDSSLSNECLQAANGQLEMFCLSVLYADFAVWCITSLLLVRQVNVVQDFKLSKQCLLFINMYFCLHS